MSTPAPPPVAAGAPPTMAAGGAPAAAAAGAKGGKKDKKNDKAARRAADKAAKETQAAAGGAVTSTGAPNGQAGSSGGVAGPSSGNTSSGGAGAPATPRVAKSGQQTANASANASAGAGGAGPGNANAAGKGRASATGTDPLQLFLHLDLPSSSSSLSHSSQASTTNIHPSIIRLALQYSEFKIVGANARCIAFLDALKDVINSYTPPLHHTLNRNLGTTHFNPQINHLIRARPLSVSMGSALRYLKYEISLIEPEVDLDDAKELLIEKIDAFVRDRILLADKVIETHACKKIKDGEVVLTYARSSVVEGVLLEAKRQGKVFHVVVVDSRPLYEGKNLLASLLAAGIETTYVLLPSIAAILPKVSLCLLGTHSLLSNGSMFSRAGTAMVAMMLKDKGVPVVCCCETYKFSERIMLDSIVGNQMGSSAPLVQGLNPDQMPNLSPLSLLYDVARPEDVTAVITEAGMIPVQSVPVVLRDFKPLLQGS